MRFFVDTANVVEIEEAFNLGFISGVTTNPALIHKERPDNKLKEHLMAIRSVCDGEILAQVVAGDVDNIVRQAMEIASWDNNVTVKVPLIQNGLKAVSILKEKGIRTCNTITFSPAQALVAAMAGADYIAPFFNRTNKDTNCGLYMVKDIAETFKASNVKTKILAASVDSPMDVVNMAKLGVDVITAPLKIWKATMENTLTNGVLEKFLAGWKGDEF